MMKGSSPRQRGTKNEGITKENYTQSTIKVSSKFLCENIHCTCPARVCPEIKRQDKAARIRFDKSARALLDKFFPEEEIVVVPESCQDDGGICGDINKSCIKTSCKRER